VRIIFDEGSDALKYAVEETEFSKDDEEDKAEEYSIFSNKSVESGLMSSHPRGEIELTRPALLG